MDKYDFVKAAREAEQAEWDRWRGIEDNLAIAREALIRIAIHNPDGKQPDVYLKKCIRIANEALAAIDDVKP